MFFIHPMWDSESQRIGKYRCTPLGYLIHGISELLGFTALLLLFIAPVLLIKDWIRGTFQTFELWILITPLCLGILSELSYRFSWKLAQLRGFHYDYERLEASWIEEGQRVTYTCPDSSSPVGDAEHLDEK